MGTINELNTTDTLADDDKLVLWKTQAGATRAITAEDAATYFSLAGGPYQPLDELLTAIAGLGPSTAAGDFIELTAQDTVRVRKLSVATYAALTVIPASFRFDDMLVYVAGRATDGDGGHGWWRFDAASSASANGGTILAPDAGTGRWIRQYSDAVHVQWFGAIGNGVADDTAAIQAAIDYVETLNGGKVLLNWGTFKITSTLNINSGMGVQLIGQGSDGIHDGGTGAAAATTIGWAGSAGGTMLSVSSASGAGNSLQFGTSVIDIKFQCGGTAGIGLLVTSVRNGNFSRLVFLNPTIAGLKATTLGNANLAEASDVQRCVFDRLSVRTLDGVASQPAHGIWLTSHSPVGANANVSLNWFTQCDMQMYGGSGGGYGLFIEDGDNNTFHNLRVSRVSTTVEAVRIVGNTNTYANHFWNLSAGGANGIVMRGVASGFAIDPQRHTFWAIDNANGTLYPTADAGVQFLWNVDAGQFVKPPIVKLPLGDNDAVALAQRAAITTESLLLSNASNDHVRLTDGTNVWGVSIDSATGDLRIIRAAGTGKLNLGNGAPVIILAGDVSVGANDSGGVGFKLLRIPN
jgi:hypothetical protein